MTLNPLLFEVGLLNAIDIGIIIRIKTITSSNSTNKRLINLVILVQYNHICLIFDFILK